MTNTPSSVSPSVPGTAAMLLRELAETRCTGHPDCTLPHDEMHSAASHLEALEAVMRTMPDASDYSGPDDTAEEWEQACAAFVRRLRSLRGSSPTSEDRTDG